MIVIRSENLVNFCFLHLLLQERVRNKERREKYSLRQNSIRFINFRIVLIHRRNHGVLQAISCMKRAKNPRSGGISICNASGMSLRMKIMAEAYSALPCDWWLQWFLSFLIVKWRFTSCTPHKVVSDRKCLNQENRTCDGLTIH